MSSSVVRGGRVKRKLTRSVGYVHMCDLFVNVWKFFLKIHVYWLTSLFWLRRFRFLWNVVLKADAAHSLDHKTHEHLHLFFSYFGHIAKKDLERLEKEADSQMDTSN